MFELEEYSSGYHDGFLSKYADSSGPTLDFYISDSLQDMLDIDIKSEIASVVGSHEQPELNDYEFLSETPSPSTSKGSGQSGSSSSSGSNFLSSWLGSSFSSSNNYYQNTDGTESSPNGFNRHSTNGMMNSSNGSSAFVSTWSGPSLSSSNDFYADVGACVNPISVMPLISSSMMHMSPKTNLNANARSTTSPQPASPNLKDTRSHLAFSGPSQVKSITNTVNTAQTVSRVPKQMVAISSTVTAATTAPASMATNSALQRRSVAPAADTVRKDLSLALRKASTATSAQITANEVKPTTSNNLSESGIRNGNTPTNTIKLAPGIGGLTFASSIAYNKLKQQTVVKAGSPGSPVTATAKVPIILKRERDVSPMPHLTALSTNGHVKMLGRSVVQTASGFTPKTIASAHSPLMQNGSSSLGSPSSSTSSRSSPSLGFGGAGIQMQSSIISVKPLQQKIKVTAEESEYPKPAYSYSCLIAMALKNSRSGSLPVSEIYNFMCEHFPYFKTARKGWKNSVRHNLSLNKCFEKIEKPATNGNQRKGCLWAMNPERIIKMDEEVQKWSRKDPLAIRNAMVFPEHLEALERGEMKHGSSGDSDVELDSQSEIEEASDIEEQELEDTLVDNMFVEEELDEDEDDELLNGESVLDNDILVMNATESSADSADGVCSVNGDADLSALAQHTDFDYEVEDMYDAVDIEDDKEAVRMALSQSEFIEIGPNDCHQTNRLQQQNCDSGYQSPKRARLNINYSIGLAGEIEKMQQQQNIKQIKVQLPQQQQQQHIVVQAIGNGQRITGVQNGTTLQYQQIANAIAQHNSRKMRL